MAKAYGIDLRIKIINLVNIKKISITEVARLMNIRRSTIYLWLKRPSLEESPRPGKTSSFTKLEALKAFVLKNPSSTAIQMAQHFKSTASIMYAALKKIGFSFKKKSYLQRSLSSKTIRVQENSWEY